MFDQRRVPHAFLFSGPEGVGKFFTALQFAKMVNTTQDKANSLFINSKFSALQEPYIKLVFPLPRGKGESADDSATEKLSQDIIDSISDEIKIKLVILIIRSR